MKTFRLPYSGPSMSPVFRTGDMLLVSPNSNPLLQVGDIIAFRSQGQLIVHRLVRTPNTFKGDNSPWIDVQKDVHILGVVTGFARDGRHFFWGGHGMPFKRSLARLSLAGSYVLRNQAENRETLRTTLWDSVQWCRRFITSSVLRLITRFSLMCIRKVG